jgi:hypothetical protein
MQTAADNTTSHVYDSDSPTDDRDGGPTDDETGHEADSKLNPASGLTPQFFIRFNGSSTACNIRLTAAMNDLVAMVEQITHIPRSHVKLSVGTTSSANIWTDSWSGSIPIVDFGFVTGCTIEISVLGKGSSENWFAMSSQTTTNSIPAMPATHVTLDGAMIHGTNSNLRSGGGKNDLMLKCAANGAGARSPFS